MARVRWGVFVTQVWVVFAILAVVWKDEAVLGVVFALIAVAYAILSHHE